MKYYQVLAKKEFEVNGEVKVRWFRVGEIKVTANGGKYLKLFLHPHTDFVVVPENQDETDDLAVID